MKRLIVLFVIMTTVFFIVHSCKDSNQKKITEKNVEHALIKEIPKNRFGNDYYDYSMIQKFTKDVGLNYLNNGFDSLFVRIWYVYRSALQVIDIKKSAQTWDAEYHSMEIDLIKDTLHAVNIKTQQIHPESGWDNFINTLFSFNILNLPSESELSGYGSGDADGSSVTVEIATKKNYRIYSYTDPNVHLEFPEAKKVENIMEIIEKELGVKRKEAF